MNRSTMVLVALFVVLLVAWLLRGQGDGAPEIPPLTVPGYLEGDISLQDIKVLNKDEESPYRRYELRRDGEVLVLELEADQLAKKVPDRKWKATRSRGDQTWTAKGETYRVKMLAQVLARPFRSTYSFIAKPEELAEFGLDGATAVELHAHSDKQKVALRIGKLDKVDDDTTSTWVQDPERPEVVYQVAGHDLRTEVAVGWKDVRERKILDLDLFEVDAIELVNPRAPEGRRIVKARRPPPTAEQREALAKGGKSEEIRKSDEGWAIIEPSGYVAGDVGSWLESIERMTLTDTYDTENGAMPPDSGLDDKASAVQITIRQGDRQQVVRLGNKAPRGDQGDVYVSVEGQSIVYSVASWSSDQIIKDLDSLRDLRLLGSVTAESCDGVRIQWAEGSFRAQRVGDTWTSADVDLDPANVSDYLRDLVGTRVEFKAGIGVVAAGLDKPDRTVVLRCNGSDIVVQVAKRDDVTYGRVGAGDPFTLQSWNADRLMRTSRDFIDKHLLRWPVDEVTQLTLPDGAQTQTLVRSPSGWKVQGDDQAQVSSEAVDALLDALRTYAYHAEYEVDAKSVGLVPPAWQLQIEATDGRKASISLSETRRDNNPYASLKASGQPERLVTISAMMVDTFRKTFKDMQAGAK